MGSPVRGLPCRGPRGLSSALHLPSCPLPSACLPVSDISEWQLPISEDSPTGSHTLLGPARSS